MTLAEASVPSGVVVQESTWRGTVERPDFGFARKPEVTLDELAKAFNGRHADQQATVMDGVLVVHPGARLPESLRQPSGFARGSVVGAMDALRRVVSGIDPVLARPGGVLGSRINADLADRSDTAQLVFDGSESRIVDGLNAIARQTRKTWLVVIADTGQPAPIIQVGFVNRGGSTSLLVVQAPMK